MVSIPTAALLALVPAFLHYAAAAPGACVRTYVVQAGDTCDSISAAQSSSTYQLSAVNSGLIDENCYNLVPGETICLGTQGEDCQVIYVVQPDDDCGTVADASGTNSTIIYENNPQLSPDCANIYPGEVLCVSPTVIAPPVAPGSLGDPSPPATSDDSDDDDTATPVVTGGSDDDSDDTVAPVTPSDPTDTDGDDDDSDPDASSASPAPVDDTSDDTDDAAPLAPTDDDDSSDPAAPVSPEDTSSDVAPASDDDSGDDEDGDDEDDEDCDAETSQ